MRDLASFQLIYNSGSIRTLQTKKYSLQLDLYIYLKGMQMKSIAKVIFCSLFISTISYAAEPAAPSATQSPNQQIEQLNTTIQNQLKALQAQQQQQIATLNSQLQAQLKQMQTDLQNQIQTVNTQTQNQMKQIQTTLQQQITQVQGQIKH